MNLGDFSTPYHKSSFSLWGSRGFFHSSCSGRLLKPSEYLVSLSFLEKPRMCDRKWERMACLLLSREHCISYQILPIAGLGGVPRKDNREWLGILGRGVLLMPS